MLRPPKENDPLQQGDLIEDVPFLVLRPAFNVKAQGVQGQTRLDSQDLASFEKMKQFAGGKALHTSEVPLILQLGIIVTQSCDLDYKDHVTLARVFPIRAMIQTAKEALDRTEPLVLFDILRRMTEGAEYGHLVYVGHPGGDEPHVADLLRVQSFTKEWKECFRQKRRECLTEEGLKYFQGRLTTSTGRYATETGFWQTSAEREIAKQIKDKDNLIREAYDRLKANPAPPTP